MLALAEDSRIRSLAAMARALSRPDPLLRLLEVAAQEACTALGASTVSISRLEPGGATVRTIINVGELGPTEERWPEDETYPLADFGNLGQVIEDRTTWVASLDDPTSDPTELQLLRELEKGSALGSPILVDGSLWGEFYATQDVDQTCFDVGDVDYVEALIAILGGALARTLREENLERLAFCDPLTGLANRRALDQHAAEVWKVPAGISRSVTVLAVDINGLKEVNDGWGHPAGDELIAAVADALRVAFAPMTGSLVARVGGDEFTVLVSGYTPASVIEVANALCRRSWTFGHGAGISCGAASIEVTAEGRLPPAAVFAAADHAQYVAKRARLTSAVVVEPGRAR